MAAAITQSPQTQCSAYRPVRFTVNTDTTPDAFEKCVVKVYNADTSTQIGEFRKDWIRRGGSGPAYFYTFEVDIAGFLQSLIAPLPDAKTDVFLPFTDFAEYSESNSIRVYCTFQFEYRNADNLLEDYGSLLTSSTITVFNLIQQHEEYQNLGPWVTNPSRNLLHDFPASGVDIRLTEAYSISFVCHTNITTARIVFTQTNGVVDFAYYNCNPGALSTYSNIRVMTAAAGPRNVNAIPPGEWLVAPQLTIDETIASYVIDFGSLSGSDFTPLTDSVKFNVVEACPNTLRIHWLNERGGADAYTFDARKRDVYEAKSTQAQRSLTWTGGADPHDRQQIGTFKTGTEAVELWEVETRILMADVAAWLAPALISVEVYIEDPVDDFYLPAIISDAKVETDETEEIGKIIKFTVAQANEKITHRL